MSSESTDEIPRVKPGTGKARPGHVAPTPDAASPNLRVNSMESVISGLQRLRNESISMGLPKVTACIDYAYYEALGALRESRGKPGDDKKSLP